MSKSPSPTTLETLPQDRIKSLADAGSNVTVNPDVKASAYLKSGRELIRSANNYFEDGNLENAFVLYTRYLTIFLEKIHSHPGYKEIPATERKMVISYCSKVLPKAEQLREQLLQKYEEEFKEYKAYLRRSRKEAGAKSKEEIARGETDKGDNSGIPWKWNDKWPISGSRQDIPIGVGIPDPEGWALAPSASAPDTIYRDVIADFAGRIDTASLPGVDRSTKPTRFLSPMTSGLRQVIIPGDLTQTFLKCADKNTKNNIETCGFLTGRILQGKLTVTDLIIPKQDGTSDSCTAKKEEECLELQDRLDLITFGWIHTHPSQTAFLSSVDLHCQFGYQQMMPEALAIVCAPSKQEEGFFTLNPIEGMEAIGKCKETNFHQHTTSTPLFFEAEHYTIDTTRQVNVHDLRYSY